MLTTDFRKLQDLERRITQLEEAPVVLFKVLHKDAKAPEYQTEGAAGLDLVACNDEPITLMPGECKLIPTGLAIQLPAGFEAQVRPRSGLSLKGIGVANSPGTIDEDYRGEVKVILSTGNTMFTVKKGERIAQLVVTRVAHAGWVEVDELSATARGASGFGSTGNKSA